MPPKRPPTSKRLTITNRNGFPKRSVKRTSIESSPDPSPSPSRFKSPYKRLPKTPIEALIQTKVQFDGQPLFTTAKSYTPSEFNFDAFTRKEVIAVTEYAEDKG